MTPLIKTLTIDNFYLPYQTKELIDVIWDMQFVDKEFGKEIENFCHVPNDMDDIFKKILGFKTKTDLNNSGVFRKPSDFIHFESFYDLREWMFIVSLTETTVNIFEHKTGAVTALDNYNFNYRNLFEWDLMCNYVLKPGQGIFFRPWLFHSISSGLIQTFRLKDDD